ncbi:MAG: D-alanine--D-alanine ligase family protein [Pseudonocardiaceae bacterium]
MTVKLVVIFGGDSPEHEISLTGAKAVLNHAFTLGWDVLSVGVTRDGRWLVGAGALERLWRDAAPRLLPKGSSPTDDVPGCGGSVQIFCGPPPSLLFSGYQLALPVCHGRWGEDGTVQGLLACYGLRIVGCGVAASAVCFDKHLTRSVLAAAGLPIAKGVRVHRREHANDPNAVVDAVADRLGAGPWFVKPVRGGSSLGIGRAESDDDLHKALREAFRWDGAALIEEAVPHREMVFGVVGRDDLVISPPGECVPVGLLYTYEEKYRLGNPGFTCPAAIEGRLMERGQELAAEVFRVLGCSVFARVDLFLDRRTGEFLINEVNTIPGMTEVSVFPKVMRAAGYSYPELLAELCRLAARE